MSRFFTITLATLVIISSNDSPFGRRFLTRSRQKRAPLDTRYMDIVREALHSLAVNKENNHNFLRAIHEIEKSLSSMQARKALLALDEEESRKFMKILELSAKSGNIKNFREVLGRVLLQNLTRLHKMIIGATDDARALLDGAKAFLNNIKAKIGREQFENLVSINGEVTLVFVIDSTGSMKEDINAAKAIAQEIIFHKRIVPVNFILSTFRDPDVDPVVYHDENHLHDAVTAIENITADGGGDCPEMTFQGILEALYYSPIPGSAMYVFTDAYAKDDTIENIETVSALAIDLGISIYFFTSGDCGGHSEKMARFKQVSQATGGLMFPLHSSKEIKKLSTLVKDNIEGEATVDQNAVDETTEKHYNIVVDDTITKMVVTIVMSKARQNIELLSPNGVKQNVTKRFYMNAIFTVKNPTPGNWTLKVPSTAGDVEYQVKTISKLNIDFNYYYFKYLPRMKNKNHIPVAHPLLGEYTMVMITVQKMKEIDNTSLSVNVLYKNGTKVEGFQMRRVGDSEIRYIARIKVDEGPYRLQLVGMTKSGRQFTRLSQSYNEGKPFRLRLVYGRKYVLPLGKSVNLILSIDNPSMRKYDFDVSDSFGYAMDVTPQGRYTRNGRPRHFKLRFKVPMNATEHINKTNRVVIKAIEKQTRIVSTVIAQLLVTPTNLD